MALNPLDKELIRATYNQDLNRVKELIEKGADPNCQCDEETAKEKMLHLGRNYFHLKGSTPLIVILLKKFLFSLGKYGIILESVKYLLNKGAKSEVTNSWGCDALYYITHPNIVCDSENFVNKIIESIISAMKTEDLNREVECCESYNPMTGLITIGYITRNIIPYSRLEIVLAPQFGDIFPMQYQIAKTLIEAGIDPNSISAKNVDFINDHQKIEITNSHNEEKENRHNDNVLDFAIFALAHGLKMNNNWKKLLNADSRLKFFYDNNSSVDFECFFQNVRNDEELLEGLVKISHCIKDENQKAAFTLWVEYGISKFNNNSIDSYFVKVRQKLSEKFLKEHMKELDKLEKILTTYKTFAYEEPREDLALDTLSLTQLIVNSDYSKSNSDAAKVKDAIDRVITKDAHEFFDRLINRLDRSFACKFINTTTELACEEPRKDTTLDKTLSSSMSIHFSEIMNQNLDVNNKGFIDGKSTSLFGVTDDSFQEMDQYLKPLDSSSPIPPFNFTPKSKVDLEEEIRKSNSGLKEQSIDVKEMQQQINQFMMRMEELAQNSARKDQSETLNQLEQARDSLNKNIEDKDVQIRELNKKNETLLRQRGQLKIQMQSLEQDELLLESAYKAKEIYFSRKAERLKEKNAVLENELLDINVALSQIEKELNEKNSRIDCLKREKDNLKLTIKDKDIKIAELNKEGEASIKKIGELKEEAHKLATEKIALRDANERLTLYHNKQVEELKSKSQVLEDQLENLNAVLSNQRKEKYYLLQKLETERKDRSTKAIDSNTVKELSRKVDQLNVQIKTLEQDKLNLENENIELKRSFKKEKEVLINALETRSIDLKVSLLEMQKDLEKGNNALDQLRNEKDRLEKSIEDRDIQIENSNKEKEILTNELNEQRKKVWKLEQDQKVLDNFNKDLLCYADKQAEELEREKQNLAIILKDVDTRLIQKQNDLDEESKLLLRSEKELNELRRIVDREDNRLESLNNDKEVLLVEINELRLQVNRLEMEKHVLNNSNKDLEEYADEQLEKLEKEKENLRNEIKDIKLALSNKQKELDKIRNMLEKLTQEKNNLNESLAKKDNEIRSLNIRLKEQKEQEQYLSTINAMLDQKVLNLESELMKEEKEKNMIKENEQFLVKELTTRKSENNELREESKKMKKEQLESKEEQIELIDENDELKAKIATLEREKAKEEEKNRKLENMITELQDQLKQKANLCNSSVQTVLSSENKAQNGSDNFCDFNGKINLIAVKQLTPNTILSETMLDSKIGDKNVFI